MCLLLLFAAAGCKTVAKATGRFALGTLTSGGNPVAGAQNAALGAAIDVASDPKGEIEANKNPQIVTVYAEAEGLQRVIPWKQGLTVYSVCRLAKKKGAIVSCKIERGDKTMTGNFKTVLEPGDVLRFGNP